MPRPHVASPALSAAAIATLFVIAAVALTTATDRSGTAGPVVIRHDRDEQLSTAMAERFDATGRFAADGSCALIRPTWVLTAGHVAASLSPFNRAVRFGDDAYEVRRVIMHPDSRQPGREQPGKVDLALVELAAPVVGVEPVGLHRRDDEAGETAFIVGYGDFGSPEARLRRSQNTRHAATNVIDAVETGRLIVTFDGPPDGTELEGVGGPGDSGGPLYLETDDGVRLAGISSASFGGRPGQYGVRDVYVRVSAFADWIDREIADPTAPVLTTAPIVDVATDGYPDTDRGRCCREFFEAVNSDDATALVTFGDEHRAAAARAERSSEDWAGIVRSVRDRWGALEPIRYAARESELLVLTRTDAGWRLVTFMFEPGPPVLDGIAFQPAAPPEGESPSATGTPLRRPPSPRP